MTDQNNRYYTMWRGERKGPFDVATLKEKIRANEISLLHKILVKGSWVSVKSFLESQRVPAPQEEPVALSEPEWEDHEREEKLVREIERLQGELQSHSQNAGAAPAQEYHQGPPAVYQYHQPPPPPKQDQTTLVTAGWITLGVSFLLPPLAIVPFILGIILMAKSEVGHGISVFLLTGIVPVMGGLFWMAVFESM